MKFGITLSCQSLYRLKYPPILSIDGEQSPHLTAYNHFQARTLHSSRLKMWPYNVNTVKEKPVLELSARAFEQALLLNGLQDHTQFSPVAISHHWQVRADEVLPMAALLPLRTTVTPLVAKAEGK